MKNEKRGNHYLFDTFLIFHYFIIFLIINFILFLLFLILFFIEKFKFCELLSLALEFLKWNKAWITTVFIIVINTFHFEKLISIFL